LRERDTQIIVFQVYSALLRLHFCNAHRIKFLFCDVSISYAVGAGSRDAHRIMSEHARAAAGGTGHRPLSCTSQVVLFLVWWNYGVSLRPGVMIFILVIFRGHYDSKLYLLVRLLMRINEYLYTTWKIYLKL